MNGNNIKEAYDMLYINETKLVLLWSINLKLDPNQVDFIILKTKIMCWKKIVKNRIFLFYPENCEAAISTHNSLHKFKIMFLVIVSF